MLHWSKSSYHNVSSACDITAFGMSTDTWQCWSRQEVRRSMKAGRVQPWVLTAFGKGAQNLMHARLQELPQQSCDMGAAALPALCQALRFRSASPSYHQGHRCLKAQQADLHGERVESISRTLHHLWARSLASHNNRERYPHAACNHLLSEHGICNTIQHFELVGTNPKLMPTVFSCCTFDTVQV